MLETMFQHPGKVQCDMYMCHVLRTRFIFKESTPYFLLVKLRVFIYKIRSFIIFLKDYLGNYGFVRRCS